MTAADHRELEARIDEILDKLARQNPTMPAFLVRDTRALCRVGEWRVALENLCQNLYEDYEVPIRLSAELYDAVAAVARDLQMPERDYDFLAKRVESR